MYIDGAHNARFLRRLVQLTHDVELKGELEAPGTVTNAIGSNASAQQSSTSPATGDSANRAPPVPTGAAGAGPRPGRNRPGDGRNYLQRPPRSRYLLAFLRETLDLRKLFRRRRHRQPQAAPTRPAHQGAQTAQVAAPSAHLAADDSSAPSQVRQQPPLASSSSTSLGLSNTAFTASLDSLENPPSSPPLSSSPASLSHAHQQGRSAAAFSSAVQLPATRVAARPAPMFSHNE